MNDAGLTCCYNTEDFLHLYLQFFYYILCYYYVGDPFLDKYKFDVEDIVATAEMKCSKVPA